MATATTNKLPNFGENATLDSSIVNDTSELKETGFQPNTTIQSSQMNTYVKIAINALRGIVDTLYRNAIEQGEINANSTAEAWQTYLTEGLNDLITKTKVDNATTADTTTGNAGTATKLQTPRTINISGDATGTAQSFDGTKNVVIPVDVKKAAALDSTNVGDATHPVYFDANGKPVKIDKVANASQADNAAAATKLAAARIIQLIGDVIGQVSFDGTQNVQINTTSVITNAKQVVDNLGNPLTVGSTNVPIYFNNGVPEELTETVFDKEWITINPNASGNFQMPGLLTFKNGSIEVLFGESDVSTYPQSFGVVSYHDFGKITEVCSLSVDNNGTLFMLRYSGNSMSIYKDSGSGFVKLNSGIMYVKKLQRY